MKNPPSKKRSSGKKVKIVVLPVENSEMEKYVDQNRPYINNILLDTFDFAIRNKMTGIEVFGFKDTNFVVVVSRKDFRDNIQNIYDFSLENEDYENCGKAKAVIDRLDKFSYALSFKKTNNKINVKDQTSKK